MTPAKFRDPRGGSAGGGDDGGWDDDRDDGGDVTITTFGYEVTVTATVLPRSVRAKGANKGNCYNNTDDSRVSQSAMNGRLVGPSGQAGQVMP